MILTNDPNSKLPCIHSYSQPTILVYKRLGSLVDEDCCDHYYHDQLQRIDPEKWGRAVKFASEQFPSLEHEKTANFFQVVLCEYFGKFTEIDGIYTGINQSDGYQYWVFAVPKKPKVLTIERSINDLRQPESDVLLELFKISLAFIAIVGMGYSIFNLLELGSTITKIQNDFIQESKKVKVNGEINPRKF
jgi:hypothetical protein